MVIKVNTKIYDFFLISLIPIYGGRELPLEILTTLFLFLFLSIFFVFIFEFLFLFFNLKKNVRGRRLPLGRSLPTSELVSRQLIKIRLSL